MHKSNHQVAGIAVVHETRSWNKNVFEVVWGIDQLCILREALSTCFWGEETCQFTMLNIYSYLAERWLKLGQIL